MSCTPSSSKQTRNIRNLDSAKRIERPLDYISQQATTGKTPVKRKRLVKVRVSIQYQTSIVCWLIGTSRHATHATRVSVAATAWVSPPPLVVCVATSVQLTYIRTFSRNKIKITKRHAATGMHNPRVFLFKFLSC